MDRTIAIAIGVAAGGIIIGGAVVVAAFVAKSHPAVAAESAQPVHDDLPPPPPKPEPTIFDQKTLADVLRFISADVGQPKADQHSLGAMELVAWSFNNLRWDDVGVTEDETNYGMAQKSIDSARGKRLCISGTIIQISEEHLKGGTLNAGLISSAAGNLFYFMGIGSSGQIVESSWARFCGVVIDKYDYSNSAGGSGHAIDVVGMFDIPENRTRKVVTGLPARPKSTAAATPDPLAHPKSVYGMPTYTTQSPPPPTPTASSDDCSPPYTMDANGHKVWKRGCF